MTSFKLINIHENTKKAERTNEEILELIGEFIKASFPKKVTIDEISGIADRHFNSIRNILLENKSSSNPIRKLFLKRELQDGLKHLFLINCKQALGIKAEGDSLTISQEQAIKDLNTHLQSLSKEECDDFYKIFDQYGKEVKKQGLQSIGVFKAIKLFFQEIIAKFKNKNLEDFNDKHTVKVDNGTSIKKGSKQEVHEPDREITYPEEAFEQKVSKSPTLETIVEEDEDQNVKFDYVRDVQKGIYENINFSVIPKFVREETLSQPQVAQIREKPAILPKSQKVIDAGNKIRDSQKTETSSYVSQLTVNLKPANEKPKIAPKPTVKIDTQTEKQYGKNVASRVQLFESLSSNVNSKPKVKGNVESLVEKFEAKGQVVSRSR